MTPPTGGAVQGASEAARKSALSLRTRLTLIIMPPLLVIAASFGALQLQHAQRTGADLFDRSMLSAALAVSNDVTLQEGDALSVRTRALLADTSGGLVYYHMYAPDGVIVAGYATPPVGIPRPTREAAGPAFFSATYLGRPVRGVRLQNRATIDGFSGVFTTTVWQDTAVRDAFVRDLLTQSLLAIGGLLLSVALVVWFGVRVGLRPLADLQDAIDQRSSEELSPIKRRVPIEVGGIVERLNSLFDQVSKSILAQKEFISNAAHQLRNPIAGVLALAETVERAPSFEEAQERARDLVEAARETAELTQQLLMLERAKAISPAALHRDIDLAERLERWADALRPRLPDDVSLALTISGDVGPVTCDPPLLREAVFNLVDNAQRHGGPALSRIEITAERADETVRLTVADDGVGMRAEDTEAATARFSQLAASTGSGLGLPIVEAIAAGHGGTMTLVPGPRGLAVRLDLPV